MSQKIFGSKTRLEGKGLHAIANLIKQGKAKRIIIMAGAGISTSAGIPDFRSPGTGLYSNLAKYNLPFPEAIFDISYFKKKPEPFYELAHELYPGNFLPTLTHTFINLLHNEGVLLRCFTQNIDTLERIAGLPDEMIVEAHGSFATARCIKCKYPVEKEWIKAHIDEKMIPRCEICTGLIKPDITFFGEDLPGKFFERIHDFKKCDLLIVVGTSLQVQPFSSLISEVPQSCPRILINMERAGESRFQGFNFAKEKDFDGTYTRKRDIFYQGDCNMAVRELCEVIGWLEKLERMHMSITERLRKEWNLEAVSTIANEESSDVAAKKAELTAAAIARAAENANNEVFTNDKILVMESKREDDVIISVSQNKSLGKDNVRVYDIEICEKESVTLGVVDKLADDIGKVRVSDDEEILTRKNSL